MVNIFLPRMFFLCDLEHRSNLSDFTLFCVILWFFFPSTSSILADDLARGGRLLCTSYMNGWIAVTLNWEGSTQFLAPGVVFGHLVLYVSGKLLNSELYMMGWGRSSRASSILWNCVFNCRSRKAEKTKQSHQLPGRCLCSVFFALCNKLKKKEKRYSVYWFSEVYMYFWFLFVLIFEVHVQVQAKNKKEKCHCLMVILCLMYH